MLTKLVKIIFLLSCLIAVFSASASTNSDLFRQYCVKIKALNKQVLAYQCPFKNENLAHSLRDLAHNKILLRKICSAKADRHDCHTGALSLPNESIGLSNIAADPKEDYCRMALEDKTQESWYLSSYVKKRC